MKNYRIIEISYLGATYLGATNSKKQRVKIKETTNGINETKIIPLNYKFDNIRDQAIEYLTNIGINIVATASTDNKYILLSDSWPCKGDFISVKNKFTLKCEY